MLRGVTIEEGATSKGFEAEKADKVYSWHLNRPSMGKPSGPRVARSPANKLMHRDARPAALELKRIVRLTNLGPYQAGRLTAQKWDQAGAKCFRKRLDGVLHWEDRQNQLALVFLVLVCLRSLTQRDVPQSWLRKWSI